MILFLPHWLFSLSLLILSHFPNTSIMDCPWGQPSNLFSFLAIHTPLVIPSILMVLYSIYMLTPNFAMLVQLTVWINHCICYTHADDWYTHTYTNEIYIYFFDLLQFNMAELNSNYLKLCLPQSSLPRLLTPTIPVAQSKIFESLLPLIPLMVRQRILLTLPSKYTEIHFTSHNLH